MNIRTLGPGFAAEVTGIDPSRPIAETEAVELRALLDQHQLLVVRGGAVEPSAHVDFVNIFCPVWQQWESAYTYASNVVGTFPQGRLLFHQDHAFTPWPHRVQSLYAEDLAGDVAPTLFVSNLRAFEKLTAEQRTAWAGLTVVHARDNSKTGTHDDEFVRVRLLELPDSNDETLYSRAVHPLIWNHPRTGMPMLVVNEYYTSHIPELGHAEGERIILDAFALTYDTAGIYTHEWQLGDLVVWDNLALQHARSGVNPASRRTLRRIVANDHIAEPEFIQRKQRTYHVSTPPNDGSDTRQGAASPGA